MKASFGMLSLMCAFTTVWGCAGAGMPSGDFPDLLDPPDAAHDLSVTGPNDLAGKDLAKAPMDLTGAGSTCNPSATMLGANGGPDVCNYGEYCDASSMHCLPVPVGTCSMVSGAPAWDEAGKTAPVIATISAELLATTDSTTECANGDPAALVTVSYYAPETLTTATTATMFYPQVKWSKSVTWYSGTFMRMMPAANSKQGTFQVGINCGGAAGSVKTAGFYIVDENGKTSNATCVSWM